ncbi:hypothetical protein [Tsuneonella sp. HG222]
MKDWLKCNSVQVMAVWSVLGGIIVAMWPVAHWALDEVLPDDPLWRIPFAVVVSAVTFGSYFYARLRPQPKLGGKPDGK